MIHLQFYFMYPWVDGYSDDSSSNSYLSSAGSYAYNLGFYVFVIRFELKRIAYLGSFGCEDEIGD